MNSLKMKVGLASTLFILVFGCLTAGHFVYKEWNYRMQSVESEIKKAASFLVPQAYLLLKQQDPEALLNYTQVVKSIVEQKNFVFVEIVNSDGKVIVPLGTVGRKTHTRAIEKGVWGNIAIGQDHIIHKESYEDVGNVLEGVFGIVEKNVILGYVVMGVSINPIYESLTKSIGGTLFLLVVLMGLSGFMSWKFAQRAASPVTRLTEVVEQYNDSDSLEKFNILGNREVEVLSSKIKNLVSKIKGNENELKFALEQQANVQRKTEQQIRSILDGFRRLSRSYQLDNVAGNICALVQSIVFSRDVLLLLSVSPDGDGLVPIESGILEEMDLDRRGRAKFEVLERLNFLVYPKSYSKTEFSLISSEVVLNVLNKRAIDTIPSVKNSAYKDLIHPSYQSCILCPLISGEGKKFGMLFLGRSDENQFDPNEIDTLRSLMEPIGTALENVHLYSQVEKLATCDSMTGLLNRENIRAKLMESLRISKRDKSPVFVAVCDIDKFKNFNDTYGHLAGDKVIKTFANILKRANRLGDYIGRQGGEEFKIIIRNTTLEGAKSALERIFKDVREMEVSLGSSGNVSFRVSVGLASYPLSADDYDNFTDKNETAVMDELIGRADEALYQAKNTGRDRYVIWTDKTNSVLQVK